MLLMEPYGALWAEVVEANPLKDMVGPCGLEPQTSTVSKILGERAICVMGTKPGRSRSNTRDVGVSGCNVAPCKNLLPLGMVFFLSFSPWQSTMGDREAAHQNG